MPPKRSKKEEPAPSENTPQEETSVSGRTRRSTASTSPAKKAPTAKMTPAKSPAKSPAKTPSRKADEKAAGTSKPENTEEIGDVESEDKRRPSPRKRRTPKADSDESLATDMVEAEPEEKTSPKKSRTPRKTAKPVRQESSAHVDSSVVVESDDTNDFEMKEDEQAKKTTPKKGRSPRKAVNDIPEGTAAATDQSVAADSDDSKEGKMKEAEEMKKETKIVVEDEETGSDAPITGTAATVGEEVGREKVPKRRTPRLSHPCKRAIHYEMADDDDEEKEIVSEGTTTTVASAGEEVGLGVEAGMTLTRMRHPSRGAVESVVDENAPCTSRKRESRRTMDVPPSAKKINITNVTDDQGASDGSDDAAASPNIVTVSDDEPEAEDTKSDSGEDEVEWLTDGRLPSPIIKKPATPETVDLSSDSSPDQEGSENKNEEGELEQLSDGAGIQTPENEELQPGAEKGEGLQREPGESKSAEKPEHDDEMAP